jgi:pentatricopeptide repeat protein
MLKSGKYDLVHEYFRKMKKSGEAPKALTYRGDFSSPFSVIGFGVWWLIHL